MVIKMKALFIVIIMVVVGINLTGCTSLPSDSTVVPGERVPSDVGYD